MSDAQVVWPDSVDGAYRPAEYVVEPAEFTRSLDCLHIFRLFDYADQRRIASRVAADQAGGFFSDVAADVAEPNLVANLDQHFGQPGHIEGFGLKNVEGDALSGFRPDSRQPSEFVDQFLNDSLVHVLPRPVRWNDLFLNEVRAEDLTNNGFAVSLRFLKGDRGRRFGRRARDFVTIARCGRPCGRGLPLRRSCRGRV